MNDDRKRILGLLADGKITADEAERLIAALERRTPTVDTASTGGAGAGKPKYLRVEVDADGRHGGPAKVNVRVPMTFLRAGVGFEVMDTGAACRTFNVLVAEQRRVTALLLL